MKRRAHTDVSASHPGCLSVVRLAYFLYEIFFLSSSIFSQNCRYMIKIFVTAMGKLVIVHLNFIFVHLKYSVAI